LVQLPRQMPKRPVCVGDIPHNRIDEIQGKSGERGKNM
jgi:hypothetical protein